MKIDFIKQEEVKIDNFKGGEKYLYAKMYNDNKNRILYGRLIPGASIGMHTHTDNSEIIFVLKGTPLAICDGIEERIEEGNTHYCPKGSKHTLINDTNEDVIIRAVIANQ